MLKNLCFTKEQLASKSKEELIELIEYLDDRIEYKDKMIEELEPIQPLCRAHSSADGLLVNMLRKSHDHSCINAPTFYGVQIWDSYADKYISFTKTISNEDMHSDKNNF